MILNTVFAFEWKKIAASFSFWGAVIFLFLISIFALQNGKNIITTQKHTIESAIQKEHRVFDEIVNKFAKPDTSTAKKKWDFGKLTDPSWTLISPNKRWTSYWQPSSSSFLALGNRDIYPYYHELEPYSFYMRFFKSEISSPFKLLFGNFDLAFVILLIFPLFIIAFTFDCHSAEVENGTYAIINAISKASVVVNIKMLFYYVITLLLLNTILALSIFYYDELNLFQWLKFTLVANVYVLVWYVISFFFLKLKKSSVRNAITFLAVWVFLVIGLPSIANAIANAKYPVNTEIFSKYIRRVQLNPNPSDLKKKISDFTKLYPQYKNTDTSTYLLFGKAYAVSGEFNDRDGDKALKIYLKQLKQREDFLTQFNFFNPVTQCQQAFTSIGESDLDAYISYLKEARGFVQVVKEDLLNKYFTGQEMKATDFKNRLTFKEFLTRKKN